MWFFSSSSLYRNLKYCCWFSNNAERRTGTWKWVNIGLRWYRLLKFLLNRNSGKLFTTLVKPIWKNRQGNSGVVVGEHSKKAFSFFIYIFFLDLLFPSNHNIHKSSHGLCFWASDPLIENFLWNLSINRSEVQTY